MSLAGDIAAFARGAKPNAESYGAERVMALSVFDWAACGMAGSGEPVSRILRGLHANTSVGTAAIFGQAGGVSAPVAALINGATSHALDYDDTHFAHIGHPSVAIIPAALAVGQSGADTLWAALIGAEVSVRVGEWLGRTHYQVGFHQTATAGAFGATVAAGLLLGLSQAQFESALGVAATQAAGLKSQFGTMGKPYHAGLAARTGVEAAMLARAGFDTRGAGLDGSLGFGATHHGEFNGAAFDDVGHNWRMETVSHKFHACCHGLHAMLEALSTIDVDAASVARVTVRTHPRWLTVCHIAEPATGLETKFSYRHTAAMALLRISTSALNSFTDTMAADPDLATVRQKVVVDGDDSLSEMQAHVTLETSAGTLTACHDLNAPLSYDDRAERLRYKARALVGAAHEAALWRAVDTHRAPDLDALQKVMIQPV